MRFATTLGLAFLSVGCASATPPVAARAVPAPASTSVAQPSISGVPAAQGPKALPELAKQLEAAGVTGTLALYDTQDGVLGCSDLKKCQEAVTPASTFKIPHSMIALETGVVEGPDTILPWDKQNYSNDNWNKDLTFREAFRFSCVPCYRAIARKVGEAGEREWLNKLAYGNRDTSGGADKFWLDAGLLISPLGQIDFLRRFDDNQLPISANTADLVRDIMTLDVTEKYVLRAKTGTTGTPEESRMLAWLVGWLEAGKRRVFFALLLDGNAPGVDPLQVRRPLIERILKSKGLM